MARTAKLVASKWNTVEDKEWFIRHFQLFVESGFDEKKFTEKFYKRLIGTFGHIAHYNKDGFYTTWFHTIRSRVQFLEELVMWRSPGDPTLCYSDAERAISDWVRRAGYLEFWRAKLDADVLEAERAEYERLKAKFEGSK